MTPEQRERMEFYAGRGTQLAIAVRAALAEVDALSKAIDELGAPVEPDAMCAELVKCGTFTEEAQKQREFISVEKSIYAELCKDRERLLKLDLWAEIPDEWARTSGKRWSWKTCSNDEYDTLREAIDARAAKEEAWVGESCQS